MTGIFEMVAKTQAGFEQALAEELKAIGAADIRLMRRAVAFRGDQELLYRANLWLRTALRILVPIRYTTAHNADELYRETYKIKWNAYFSKDDTFAIDCTSSGREHHHSLYAALKVKDAIADQFRERQKGRPSVDLDSPTLRINVHIQDSEVIYALDSSGDSLHKRGYRTEKNEAPLNEVTAAGMILLTGWKGDTNFGDLMCGSGTLLIEAAWIATDTAPGLQRESFGFQNWKDFDPVLWERLVNEARDRIRSPRGIIFGSDLSETTLGVAKRNCMRAGVDRIVELSCMDFRQTTAPEGGGILVMNPPYDERIKLDDIGKFYEELGDTLKQRYKGFDAWILSGNPEAMKKLGLKASLKLSLLNASIECRFQKYELYAGSREKPRLENP